MDFKSRILDKLGRNHQGGVPSPMASDYRNLAIAAVICLIAAFAVGFLLQPTKPDLTGDHSYRANAAAYLIEEEGCRHDVLKTLTRLKRVRNKRACQKAREEQQQASDSLIAAGRAADAANASAILAYEQAGIAAWGLAAGVLTLFAAGAAALYAREAANHTRRGADAAIDSARIASSTNLPILVLSSISSDHNRTAGDAGHAPETPIRIQLTFTNYGQTVAILQKFGLTCLLVSSFLSSQPFLFTAGIICLLIRL